MRVLPSIRRCPKRTVARVIGAAADIVAQLSAVRCHSASFGGTDAALNSRRRCPYSAASANNLPATVLFRAGQAASCCAGRWRPGAHARLPVIWWRSDV